MGVSTIFSPKLTEDWNLITRTIIPVIFRPQVSAVQGSEFGLGNFNPQFFLSPARSGQIMQKGWYFMYVPMLTANWVGSANDRWTVPAIISCAQTATQLGHCKFNLCSSESEA